MKRGPNLDQWVTWPTEDKWGEGQAILPYPKWRQFLKQDDLEALKDAGLDFLRMPVDPSPFGPDRGLSTTSMPGVQLRHAGRVPRPMCAT